jgi:hypothetical protein
MSRRLFVYQTILASILLYNIPIIQLTAEALPGTGTEEVMTSRGGKARSKLEKKN